MGMEEARIMRECDHVEDEAELAEYRLRNPKREDEGENIRQHLA